MRAPVILDLSLSMDHCYLDSDMCQSNLVGDVGRMATCARGDLVVG